MLTEGYKRVGQAEEGLAALAEALAAVDKTGERWYEADLYRLKGELTLQLFKVQGSKFQAESNLASSVKISPKSKARSSESKVRSTQHLPPQAEAEAEASFLKAIDIARQQQAKSWELRAVTSLARLWQQQGKKTEARQMLVEIYGWFTEGFDTKDLQEAGVLLTSLT